MVREPLLHFFVLGAGLFSLFAWVRGPNAAAPDRIRVDAARIEQLAQGFVRTWQRAPTQEELDGLVASFVREEIYYREALAMGLDRDDTIVRRRMLQKLEFLTDDLAPVAEPDDDALARHLADHADAYRIEPRLALRQILVSRDRRGAAAEADATAIVARLAADPTAVPAGDSSMLPDALPLSSLAEIERVFGREFAEQARALPSGRWSGPIESGFGLHVVRIEAREEGRAPSLDEVRDAVLTDWKSARRAEANQAFYESLRARYDVTIESAPGAP